MSARARASMLRYTYSTWRVVLNITFVNVVTRTDVKIDVKIVT